MHSSLEYENGILVYRTPYNPALVAALKTAIPASERRWDAARKAWLVTTRYADTLVQLTEQYLGEQVAAPVIPHQAAVTETRILACRYIGTTKDKGDGNPVAFAWIGGGWGAIFPEQVLREWFNAEARPDESPTLYAVLGIPATASSDELRSAYRRLAKMWHPDTCHELDATQQFQRIQHAYEVLAAPAKRARYDAGLALEATLKEQREPSGLARSGGQSYRSPLRCGLVMAEGRETLGRFVVTKIIVWEDIVDAQGRILVTSWPMGAQAPEEMWQ